MWIKRGYWCKLCLQMFAVGVQATARAADFTFANEAEVLHLASTICKVACPAPCIAPHLLTQFWFCRARQLVNLRHQTMMLLCLSRTWKWMKVTTKWLLSVHSSGCRIIITQVIARWKERGWMIGTRGSRGVGYIGVAAGCLVWSVRISVRISQWIQWIQCQHVVMAIFHLSRPGFAGPIPSSATCAAWGSYHWYKTWRVYINIR